MILAEKLVQVPEIGDDADESKFPQKLEVEGVSVEPVLWAHRGPIFVSVRDCVVIRPDAGDRIVKKHVESALPRKNTVLVGIIGLEVVDRLITCLVLLRNGKPQDRRRDKEDGN